MFIKIAYNRTRAFLHIIAYNKTRAVFTASEQFLLFGFWGFFLIVVRTFNMRLTPLPSFEQSRTVFLARDTALYISFLELIHLADLKLCTHRIATPHFLLPPSPWPPSGLL